MKNHPMSTNKQFPSPESLLDAVEKNEIVAVQKLIDGGCNVNVQDNGKSTSLMRASLHGYSDIVVILLRAGANSNIHDKIGKTALHYAAQENHENIVRILLEAGADVNSQDIHGNSPLSNAVFYAKGKGNVIRLLRQNGADDNLPNKHGITPLGLAKTIVNFDVLQHFK